MKSFALACLALLILAIPAPAQEKTPEQKAAEAKVQIEGWLRGLQFQSGTISLHNGLASLNVPADFKYLAPADSGKFLRILGNPPQETLGIIFPAAVDIVRMIMEGQDSWFVVLQYSDDGYVKDDDAAKINYNDLLKKMQEESRADNAARSKEGYATIELIGWAAPPRYDHETHKLYWAKELRFGGEKDHTLNYNIRMLGRRGVLVANAVSSIAKLGEIEAATPQILAMVDFNEGHRYADFDSSTDKVATYGIAGLIAAGIAAKAGLFKVIGIFLLKFWKIIAIAVVAIGAFLKKVIGARHSPQA